MTEFEWILEHEKWIRALCRRMSAQDHEELYAECVDRVAAIMNTWDSFRGTSLNWHIKNNLKWYCIKHLKRKARRHREFPNIERDAVHNNSSTSNRELKEEVTAILKQLDLYDQRLLVLYHLEDMNFEEIGNVLGVSKSTARNHYYKALEAARLESCGRGGSN